MLQLQPSNLSKENMKSAFAQWSERGEKPLCLPVSLFVNFIQRGNNQGGGRGVGAVDVIKAPAEWICGSGVSTSEKSMAAAVATLAVPHALPLQECSKASGASVCCPLFILYLLSAEEPDPPRFTEVD